MRQILPNVFEVSGKSHSAEKCKRGDPLGFFERSFCSKISKKLKGGPFGEIKKICEKKSHKAGITCTKKIWSRVRFEPTSFCLADIKNYPN